MKTLDKGQDKIQKICNVLRQETLEPAKHEAETILEGARAKAELIVQEAKEESEHLLAQAHKKIDQERNVYHSTLEQAGKQALEALKQAVEQQLFNQEIDHSLDQQLSEKEVVARLINAVVEAVGEGSELAAVIPKSLPPQEVAKSLAANVQKRLEKGGISIGDFAGGAQVKLLDKKMMLDVTDGALKEVLISYVRKSFRDLLFGETS